MSSADIQLHTGRDAVIAVDGHDLAANVTGFTLTAERGRLSRLELDLRIVNVTALGDEHTVVRIDQGTVDLLQRCGWVAPAGDPTVLRQRADGEPNGAAA